MSDSASESSRLRARLEGRELPDSDPSQTVSILEIIHKLKGQILDKDRIIREKAAALLSTRDYLKRIFGALTDAVFVIAPDGTVESANLAAFELLEYPEEGLIGVHARQLWADADQAGEFESERLTEIFAQEASLRADTVLLTHTGKSIPVLWTSAVLTLDGVPTGMVGIARDVRVERRLEEAKLRSTQALAASVAHEIRNPLGAIQNSVALLLRDLDLEGDDQTLLEIVFRETERISDIVVTFLDFARPQRTEFWEADLDGLLPDVVTLAKQDERAAAHELLLHVDPELPQVTFDPAQIKQVVWNLLVNALDAAKSSVAKLLPTAQSRLKNRPPKGRRSEG